MSVNIVLTELTHLVHNWFINDDMPSTQSIKRNRTLTLSSCEAYNEVGGGGMDSKVCHLLVVFSIAYLSIVCNFIPPETGSEGMVHRGLEKPSSHFKGNDFQVEMLRMGRS